MPPPPPVDLPLPPAPKRSRTPKEPRTEASRPGGSHFSMGPPAVSHLGSRAHVGHMSHAGRGRGSDLGMFASAPLPLLSADDLGAQGVRCIAMSRSMQQRAFLPKRWPDAPASVQGHVVGTTTELLDANVGLAHGIKSSLSTSSLAESAAQLCNFRDNILAILHRMSTLPGMMAQMPPLPVRPNMELAAAVLPPPGSQC